MLVNALEANQASLGKGPKVFYPIDMRACLETHLSIMKRFSSMLAIAI